MNYEAVRQQFQKDGFVVIRELLMPEEVNFYVERLSALSGISKEDFNSKERGVYRDGTRGSYNLPDGVTKTPDFWPLICNERLLATVRELLGLDVRFLQHTDLHVGFSAVSWHRDNVNRKFNVGPDWDEKRVPYKIVRVGLYLQNYEESHFRLGFIPGTHRPSNITPWRRLSEAKLEWIGALSYISKELQMWAANATWVETNPGDAIIFDPRTLHSGSYIIGPKYSAFVAYGIENKHFYDHHNYYRHIRSELGYQDIPAALAEQLLAAGLLQENMPAYDHIDGAWKPVPVLKGVFGQHFKRPLNTV